MTISFAQVSADILVPSTYVEIDDRLAGVDRDPFRTLLIGQKLAAGTAAADTPVQLGDAGDAAARFGKGSMIHLMTAAFRRQNPIGDLWGMAIDDPAAATKRKYVVTVAGAATAPGTAVLYVAGRRITAGVASGATAASVAAALAAAVAADENLPATINPAYMANDTDFTVEARHGGVETDLDVRSSYYPTDAQPAGITVTPVATAGTGAVTLTNALDDLSEERFDLIACPYTTDASMDAIEADLAERWNAQVQADGAAIGALRGTYSAATTWAADRASRYSTVIDMSDSPNADYEWAAAVAGAAALSAASDPALPFQTVELIGILPPTVAQRRKFADRQALLAAGVAAHTVDEGGKVRIDRLVTTTGTAKWRDLNQVLTVAHLRRNFRARMQSKFPRFKLADDGREIEPGERIVTPTTARLEAIAWAREMERAGLIESADAFKKALVVQRDGTDPDRLNFLLRPDLINQLRVIAAVLQFEE